MRIAVVGTRGIPDVHGGVERHCEELYPRLVDLGVDVTVYAREPYIAAQQTWRGVKVIPLAAPTHRSAEAFVHTLRAVGAARRIRPSLIHFHSIGPGGLLPLARMSGLLSVLTVHAFDYQQTKWGRLSSSYLHYGESAGVRMADGVIAVSRWMTDELRVRYHRQVHYVPNGPLAIPPVQGTRTLESLGIADSRYVLFVGRLIPDKRVEDLFAAMSDFSGVRLVVVGDTSYTDRYTEYLRTIAPRNVVFAGYRYGQELAELYRNAAVFALPSAVEGLPLSLLEALSVGLPCVASDIPANSEVAGELGWLHGVGDVPALRRALVGALALSWDDRRLLEQRQSAHIAASYDWDEIARQTLSVYERVLA